MKDNKADGHIGFFLLEKEDKPNPRAKDPFVRLNAKNNIYAAFGSFINEPLYQWAKETNTRILQLNSHVSYIHSKFLLKDPLGATRSWSPARPTSATPRPTTTTRTCW